MAREGEEESDEDNEEETVTENVNETTDEDMSSGEMVEVPSGDENYKTEETEDKEKEESTNSEKDINKETEKIVDDIIEKAAEKVRQTHEDGSKENIKNLVKKTRRKISREKWNRRVQSLVTKKIIEETPLGKVLMYYDSKTESFCYHCEKSIPYNYLETVARKYVRLHDCRPIYIDSSKELERARKEQEKMKEEDCVDETKEEETPSESNNDVFANFKNYKKQTKDPINSQMKSSKLSCSDSEIAKIKKHTDSSTDVNFSKMFQTDRKDNDKSKLVPLR